MSESRADWTAIILAGGRSRRLGEDKAGAIVGDRTLLDHVVAGVPDDVVCIVVGQPPSRTERLLVVALEDEPGGGPVAGAACGIEFVTTPMVALLAVDMPFAGVVIAHALQSLRSAAETIDAAVPVDASGRRQPLAAAYRTSALRKALSDLGSPHGRSLRDLLDVLSVADLPIDDERALLDVDTAEDLALARRSVSADGGMTVEVLRE